MEGVPPITASSLDGEFTSARDLVAAACIGSETAWRQLFDTHYPSLHRFFRSRVGDPGKAEDLASEVFLEAFRSIHNFRWQGRPFEAWLFGIARRKLASYYHAGSNRGEVAAIEYPMRDEYLAVEVRDILDRLRPEYRTALELRFVVGLSGEEAAAAMSRSHGAFRALLLRAVRAFRHASADEGSSTERRPANPGAAQARTPARRVVT